MLLSEKYKSCLFTGYMYREVHTIYNWVMANRLKLNTIKSKYYMIFDKSYKNIPVLSCIAIMPSVAYLGFHFGGGGQNFSGKVGVFAWRFAPCSAWQSHMFARGVRGHAPPRIFFKMVQFGAL